MLHKNFLKVIRADEKFVKKVADMSLVEVTKFHTLLKKRLKQTNSLKVTRINLLRKKILYVYVERLKLGI